MLFWALLTWATWALVQPLWIGTIPPFTDFPAHAAMADVWSRLDDVEMYREIFERRDGLVPNVLATRFVSLLYPLFEPVTGLRIFASLTLFGTVGALVAIARTFDRSPWLVFLALPFLWNGSMYWGMINYVAVFPFFFGSIALARKTAKTGDWRWGLGLAAVCLASFFAHGLGCLFTLGVAGFVLVLSSDRPKNLVYLTALAPTAALWIRWRSLSAGRNGLPDESLSQTLENHGRWFSPAKKLERFIEAANDLALTEQDTIVFVIIAGMWLLLMGVSSHPSDFDDTGLEGPKDLVFRVWNEARTHCLLLMVACLGVATAVFPSFIKITNVSTRVAPLFLMSCVLVPRPPRRSWIAAAAIAVSIGTSIWFGGFVGDKVEEFQRAELAPLVELIEKLPPHSRVECLGVRGLDQTVFRGRPLDLTCPSLAQIRTKGFGGYGFPGTGFNAVKFRPGYGHPTLRHSRFDNVGLVQQWDYVIVRGRHRKPSETVAELVETSKARTKKAPKWHLYRVRKTAVPAAHTDEAGGEGGSSYKWSCPEEQAIRGFTGYTAQSGELVANLRPLCGTVEARPGGRVRLDRRGVRGVRLAQHKSRKSRFSLHCPSGKFLVGVEGRAGKFVDRIQLECAELRRDDAVWKSDATSSTRSVGGTGGEPFTMRCPAGTVVQGLQGRAGWQLDSLGIRCVEIDRLVDDGSDETD